jgi:hypothetical protein
MEPISAPPNPFIAETGSLLIPSFEEWFYLPGDWVLYLLASRLPAVAGLFGVSDPAYGGTLAALIAWTCWIVFALALIIFTSAVRSFDRALTDNIVGAAVEVRRRVRMAITFVQYRRRRRAKRKEPAIDVGEEPGLSRDEMRVLIVHSKLAPGFALSTSDVARELDTRGHEIRGALERLQKLKLLQATVGGLDGETAYTLTAAGRSVLQIRRAEPRMA